jgi:hypothetical protein
MLNFKIMQWFLKFIHALCGVDKLISGFWIDFKNSLSVHRNHHTGL